MQDTEVKSFGARTGSRQFTGWIATHQRWAKRHLGHVASRLFSSGPIGGLVVVSIVSIFLLRTSG